jgi:hypothetical protein
MYVEESPGTMCANCLVFEGTVSTIFVSGIENEIGYTGILLLLDK